MIARTSSDLTRTGARPSTPRNSSSRSARAPAARSSITLSASRASVWKRRWTCQLRASARAPRSPASAVNTATARPSSATRETSSNISWRIGARALRLEQAPDVRAHHPCDRRAEDDGDRQEEPVDGLDVERPEDDPEDEPDDCCDEDLHWRRGILAAGSAEAVLERLPGPGRHVEGLLHRALGR